MRAAGNLNQSSSLCQRKEEIRRSAARQGASGASGLSATALASPRLPSPAIAVIRDRRHVESHIERAIAPIADLVAAPTLLSAADRAGALSSMQIALLPCGRELSVGRRCKQACCLDPRTCDLCRLSRGESGSLQRHGRSSQSVSITLRALGLLIRPVARR